MKSKILLASILFCAVAALASTNSLPAMPEDLVNKPVKDWVITGGVALYLLGVVGRAFQALKSGGGVKGVLAGVIGGTNTPTEPKQ